MTDWRERCIELVEALHEHTCLYEGHEHQLVARTRAELAQLKPVGSSAAELLPVEPPNISTTMALQYRTAWREGVEDGWNEARAALARWGRPAIQPEDGC